MKIYIMWDPETPNIVYDIAEAVSAHYEEYENIEDCVNEEIERFLIYTENCWAVMKTYQSPFEANMDKAIEEFENNIWAVIRIKE